MTFRVYDKVWVMSWNKPTEMIVFAVVESMDYYKRSTEIYYHLVNSQIGAGWGNNEGRRVPESKVFSSKTALLESLDADEKGHDHGNS